MDDLNQLAEQVGAALKSRGLMLATAESCTGGWAGEVVTSVPGSSHWYERGFITYTNESKQEMLGVSAQTLAEFGAVSEQTVREMAAGALKHSRAHITLAISGIAGPGGATPDKPVGTVCMAWATRNGAGLSQTIHFQGDRTAVRRQAVVAALQGVLRMIEGESVTA
ncbi:MAG: nicotinamide-nucleotide amidohydrolase family protein [Hydrogenophilales bacterium]|nr:nicotinamide-nucleotide amidohydrolase family protein [Hydrogenophilales bacterium]